jgi:uncharacterized membrane protein YuzA (DUF378 family)
MDFVYTALLFLALIASVAIGWATQHKLRERHVTREAVDSIRLLMGMLLTFAALVLGLLTSSAKQRFDSYDNDLSVYGADLIELDHRLRVYGPDCDRIRALLRSYTAAAIADTWPYEPHPSGQYPHLIHPPNVPSSIEGTVLGDMLANIDVEIEHLTPSDEFHRQIAMRLRDRVTAAIQQRWRLILSAGSTVSWPLLLVLTTWLAIIFAIFGLTSPRTRLVYVVVGLSALSIASPLYLIIDYSDALTGVLQLSSLPMRAALSHMDAPN